MQSFVRKVLQQISIFTEMSRKLHRHATLALPASKPNDVMLLSKAGKYLNISKVDSEYGQNPCIVSYQETSSTKDNLFCIQTGRYTMRP